MTGRALVAQANAVRLPLRDESVDLAVFSPPYFALRAYGAGPGEIGSEATPAEFLAALWQVMGEVKRVLKPGGSAFVNLGDKYRGQGGGAQGATSQRFGRSNIEEQHRGGRIDVIREKSLLGLPWAFALGCTGMLAALGGHNDALLRRELVADTTDSLLRDFPELDEDTATRIAERLTDDVTLPRVEALAGFPDPGLDLILRAEIIADKPNGLPESVRDRVRRSHEQWFHFTRSPRYYSALDEIRVPHSQVSIARSGRNRFAIDHSQDGVGSPNTVDPAQAVHPLGALPGSVWRIPSEPLRLPEWLGVQHYASFASEWPRRLILAFSPPGICLSCGEGRWPVVDRPPTGGFVPDPNDKTAGASANGAERNRRYREHLASGQSATILGYACNCTPFTDHPGTGEPSGPDARYGDYLAEGGGYPSTAAGWGHQSLGARPKVGPWREYHLAGWTPPPTRPAVVLDPFSGTGTTIGVARQLGRIGVGFDLSHAYCRAACYRVFQSGDFGKAEGRTWAERQGSLL